MPIKPTTPQPNGATDIAVQRIVIEVPHNTRQPDGKLGRFAAAMGLEVLVTDFDGEGAVVRNRTLRLVWEELPNALKAQLSNAYARIEEECQDRDFIPPGNATPL